MTGYKYPTVVLSQHRAWSPAAPGAVPTAQQMLDSEGLLRDDVATQCLGPGWGQVETLLAGGVGWLRSCITRVWGCRSR